MVFTLPDYLREIYRSFPLDLAQYNDAEPWTLPMPGRFVIDRAGVVRDVAVDPDYTTRPEPATTLAAVRKAVGDWRKTMDVPRIDPAEARRRVQSGQALLVCGYEDETKCRAMALEGAISLSELKRRLPSLPKSQELIFYCA